MQSGFLSQKVAIIVFQVGVYVSRDHFHHVAARTSGNVESYQELLELGSIFF